MNNPEPVKKLRFQLSDTNIYTKIMINSMGHLQWNFELLYKVVARKGDKIIPIPRILKKDFDGILYIGHTKKALERLVKQLIRSFDPYFYGDRSKIHRCGHRYRSNPDFAKKFPYDGLYLDLVWVKNPKLLETEELVRYRNEFGELPPFNERL